MSDEQAPRVDAFYAEPPADDGRVHPLHELQLPAGKGLVLAWRATGADKVRLEKLTGAKLEVLGEFPLVDGAGSHPIEAASECSYQLTALRGDASALCAQLVKVWLHEAGQPVSAVAHASVGQSADPADAWPLVLCGPMLRRVEPRRVCVFLATRLPCQLQLRVLDTAGANLAPAVWHETLALGPNLHVRLIDCVLPEPGPALQPGLVYSYDVVFKYEDPFDQKVQEQGFGALGMLAHRALGYGGDKLPGFALPPRDLSKLRLLHGSCRKPHGAGNDALALADSAIEAAADDAGERPHQLLLTGDQIYADDVDETLAGLVHQLALQLLVPRTADHRLRPGFHETLALSSTEVLTLASEGIAPGRARAQFMQARTAFTPDDPAPTHLVFLAEFFAMYLLVFSDALWPRNERGTLELPMIDPAGQSFCERSENQKDWRLVRKFAAALPSVRRALANVPTYMILDDHDVTDDWNIYRQWSEGVRASVAGTRIVRNALVAYAIFQDWGNCPARYAGSEPGASILTAVTCPDAATPPPLLAAPDSLAQLLDLGPAPAPGSSKRMRWNYTWEGEGHRLLVLDTRTWRHFPAGQQRAAAGLISPESIDEQLGRFARRGGPLAVVVSAAPVIGFPLAEEFLSLGGAAFKALEPLPPPPTFTAIRAARKVDSESWAGNPESFDFLIDKLAGFGSAIVLSGDVHYGFSATLDFEARGIEPARVVQLCSSSLHNEAGWAPAIAGLPALSLTLREAAEGASAVAAGAPSGPSGQVDPDRSHDGNIFDTRVYSGPRLAELVALAPKKTQELLEQLRQAPAQAGRVAQVEALHLGLSLCKELKAIPWVPETLARDPVFNDLIASLKEHADGRVQRVRFLEGRTPWPQPPGPGAVTEGDLKLEADRWSTQVAVTSCNLAELSFQATSGVAVAVTQTFLRHPLRLLPDPASAEVYGRPGPALAAIPRATLGTTVHTALLAPDLAGLAS